MDKVFLKCHYCDLTENETKIINKSKYSQYPVCKKHVQQLKKHGKVYETTIYDKNKISLHENYATIEIKDKLQNIVCYAKIDLDDVERVSKRKWCLDDRGYILASGRKDRIRLHRFIMNVSDSKIQVDHENHDKSDNRKSNLRICVNRQNSRNKGVSIGSVPFIGVSQEKSTGLYRARLKKDYKEVYSGKFENLEDAKKARLQAEKEYFGKFTPQKHLFKEYGIEVGS